MTARPKLNFMFTSIPFPEMTSQYQDYIKSTSSSSRHNTRGDNVSQGIEMLQDFNSDTQII